MDNGEETVHSGEEERGRGERRSGWVGLYFDQAGEPMTLMEWVMKFEDDEYQRIAETWVGKYRVSTVWLGLNHSSLPGLPLIFETMVFDESVEVVTIIGGETRSYHPDVDQERYSTRAQAERGHAEMVKRIQEGKKYGESGES